MGDVFPPTLVRNYMHRDQSCSLPNVPVTEADMKAKIAALVVALATVAPAAWAAEEEDPVGDLAQITGLSERKVQMIVGNRSSFAEYPYTYQRSLEKFVDAVGEVRYQMLIGGQPIELQDDQGRNVVFQIRQSKLVKL